ncbi:MAG: STAS domain-containing protein [Spirochaetaceae bacterium]|nr:STAS domain-containing protein [Spirochaetaceae bacterium]
MSSRLLARAQSSSQVTDSPPGCLSFDTVNDLPGLLCIHPSCPFDDEHIDALDAELTAALHDEDTYLMIDFSKVESLKAGGVGFLVALQKKMRMRNGDIVLYGLRPKLQRFLESLGFGSFFSTALDLPYAIEYIEKILQEVFPVIAECPVCSASMSVDKPGRGRCRACKAVLTILPDGSVELG